jgi:amino acid transporter/mannitol/fructose-specific phosphotransferase system IIA component (Ntr-type)
VKHKDLGFFDLFCLASGAMISSGLFVLPGIVYAKIGASSFVAYFTASLLVIPAMLSQAELATAMPKSGGTYFFVNRSMGSGLGTLAGLSSWFSLSFKSAFALIGIGAFAVLVFPGLTVWQTKFIAAGCCVVFGAVNLYGTKHAGKTQIALVVGLLALLLVYIAWGLPAMDTANLTPFWREDIDLRTFVAAAGLIFISYGGLTNLADVAGEARNPAKTVPYSMIAAFLVVSTIYALTVLVTVGLMGDGLIVNGRPSLTPISDGGGVIMGTPGKILLAVAAILAFVSTGNAGIMTASRAPMAMSNDNLLPKFFGYVSPKRGTPRNAILMTTGFIVCVVLFLELEMLVKTASTIMILLFASVNLSVILMRESGILSYQPKFRCPFYPWVQIVGILAYGFLVFEMGRGPILLTFSFLTVGLMWYWFYGRINSNRVSALVHLVRRLTASELRYDVLNSELKEILLERDEIVEDRFGRLVRKAEVLDLEGPMELGELMEEIAVALAPRVELTKKEALDLLTAREEESSTVLAPGLAVPHVIIPGKHHFELMLVRCRNGVKFPEAEEPVEALFVLAGTADERNFHLKALMSIAQIVQQDDFLKKWREATQQDGIRDFVLLSERSRQG